MVLIALTQYLAIHFQASPRLVITTTYFPKRQLTSTPLSRHFLALTGTELANLPYQPPHLQLAQALKLKASHVQRLAIQLHLTPMAIPLA